MNNFFDPEKQDRLFIRNHQLHHQSWQQQQLDHNRSSMPGGAAIASSSSSFHHHQQNHQQNHHDPSPSSSSFYSKLLINTTNFSSSTPNFLNPNPKNTYTAADINQAGAGFRAHLGADGLNDPLLSNLVPPITVVIEGRSICQRIDLHKHASYESLARALRNMFVNDAVVEINKDQQDGNDGGLDLANAVPGHIVAYEDVENDLLLAGDLNWKDFVRVAKRIRILPAKPNSKKRRQGSTSES